MEWKIPKFLINPMDPELWGTFMGSKFMETSPIAHGSQQWTLHGGRLRPMTFGNTLLLGMDERAARHGASEKNGNFRFFHELR